MDQELTRDLEAKRKAGGSTKEQLAAERKKLVKETNNTKKN